MKYKWTEPDVSKGSGTMKGWNVTRGIVTQFGVSSKGWKRISSHHLSSAGSIWGGGSTSIEVLMRGKARPNKTAFQSVPSRINVCTRRWIDIVECCRSDAEPSDGDHLTEMHIE